MLQSRLEKSSFVEIPYNEIRTRTADFESDIDRIGALCVLDNKNLCYTVLTSDKVDKKAAQKIYTLLLNCFKDLIHFVKKSLEHNEFDLDQKTQNRKCIKTYCELLTVSIKEKIISKTQDINIAKSKKSKKQDSETSLDSVWLNYCESFLCDLNDLFSFSFNNLWQPPILEEDFLRLIINFVFKLLEIPPLTKLKHFITLISDLLGLILSKHNALLNVTLKFLTIIQHVENSSVFMASIMQIITTKYSYTYLLVQLFKEIAQCNSLENLPDNAISRNIANFISVMGRIMPKEILNNTSLLLCHLDSDPYTLRNAILDCFSQIVIQVFAKTELDDILKKSRDSFLDKIQEHLNDVNAYVRSHVLQVIGDIVKEKSLPINRFNLIVTHTITRLRDKSCNVRKNAASLLFLLITNNPFSNYLNLEELEKNLKSSTPKSHDVIQDSSRIWEAIVQNFQTFYLTEFKNTILDEENSPKISIEIDTLLQERKNQLIENLKSEKFEDAISLLDLNEDDVYSCESYLDFFKNLYFEYLSNKILVENADVEEQSQEINSVSQVYLRQSIEFTKIIKASMSVVYRLLQSETTSDILEVIQLIVTIFKYGICSLNECLDNILPLVWSTEETLKKAIIEASMTVLLYSHNSQDVFIDNVFILLKNATIGFISAFEELISQVAEKNLISIKTTKTLLMIYSENDSTDVQRTQAIQLLGMISKGQPSVLEQNIELLSTVGFGKDSSMKLAISTCFAIINFSTAKRKTCEIHKMKLDINHILFRKIKSFTVGHFLNHQTSFWSLLCELTIKIFCVFGNSPFLLLSDFLKDILAHLTLDPDESGGLTTDLLSLSRVLHAVSHSAANILILLEGDFLTELKRRSSLLQSQNTKNRRNKSTSTINNTVFEDDFNTGATADETEADFVRELCENEILHEDNIFSKFIPIILHIIDKKADYPPQLVIEASLALSKFMFLSSDFCSQHLQILFTLLKKSNIENVRSNIVIIVGDIIQRFPNLVEPWMPNIFACLRDNSIGVRKVVLSILSSLILNDMVKVKGHISELALLIEDPDSTISARTRLFFSELARKDNAIYNILPDVISRLSNSRQTLDRSLFEKVMKFLLKFLQKEKHCESLVDKLCHRFAQSNNVTEQQDIVFCFSQLNLSEKSFKKMVDNFPTFKDKVYDDQLFEGFVNIIAKYKKMAKESQKTLADEFEQKLAVAHKRGLDDNPNTPQKSTEVTANTSKLAELSVIGSPKRTKAAPMNKSSKHPPSPVIKKRNRRVKKAMANRGEENSSDDNFKKKR